MERYSFQRLQQLGQHLSEKTGAPVDLLTHSFDVLMNWTEAESRMDPSLRRYWGIVRKWRIDWRYSPWESSENECCEFFDAGDKVLSFIANSI